MWLSLLRGGWRAIVAVPADPHTSARPCVEAFADIQRFYDLGPVLVRDASGASVTAGEQAAAEVEAALGVGARAVTAVDFPLTNPSGLPLLMKADAILLVVRYGATDVGSSRVVVDLVGRERILGCVAVSGAANAAPARPGGPR
jgi:hypothetical protein